MEYGGNVCDFVTAWRYNDRYDGIIKQYLLYLKKEGIFMKPTTITKANFKQEVLESKTPVLLDFWAPWCGPCRMVAPVLEELAEDLQDKAVIGKVNVDEELELAQEFGIMSIPTMIVFEGGKPKEKVIGFRAKNDIRKMLGV